MFQIEDAWCGFTSVCRPKPEGEDDDDNLGGPGVLAAVCGALVPGRRSSVVVVFVVAGQATPGRG